MATLLGKIKNGKERETALTLLKFIVAGTQGTTGDAVVPFSIAQSIEKAEPGLIIIHTAADPAGNAKVSASPSGIQAVNGTAAPAPVASSFVLEDDAVIPPASTRGGVRPETYPFDSMNVGQSFFVAATEARPNPAKALTGTVASANKRYVTVFPAMKGKVAHPQAGQPTGKDSRKFMVKARKLGDLITADPNGRRETANGARVYRTK